jgi:hypothetical protein
MEKHIYIVYSFTLFLLESEQYLYYLMEKLSNNDKSTQWQMGNSPFFYMPLNENNLLPEMIFIDIVDSICF